MNPRTDEQLMAAVRDGNVSCLGELFERHGGRLCSYLTRITQDADLSRDLVQDVFLRVLKYRGTFRDDGRFSSWLYTIAHNVVNRHFGKSRKLADVVPIDDIVAEITSDEPSPLAQTAAREEAGILRDAFSELSAEKRELLTLGMIERTPYREIATILDISETAVKVRVHRAVKELRGIYLRMVREERQHGS